MNPTFKDEVMLLGWSETHTGGAKITLQLPDSDALQPFKNMTVAKGKVAGQRLACVLVEIDDDEQPKQHQVGRPKHSQWLAIRLNDAGFRQFIFSRYGGNKTYVDDVHAADDLLKSVLDIDSKSELDSNEEKAALFVDRVIRPWADYCK